MKLRNAYLFLILLSLLSCSGEENKYVFPSVKLEFVTVQTNSKGGIVSLITDKDSVYEIETDRTDSKLDVNARERVICYYEPNVTPTSGSYAKADIWSLSRVVSPTPGILASGAQMKTDPVGIQSIWLSGRYINLTLEIKLQSIIHSFNFIEDGVTFPGGKPQVHLILYHDNKGDVEAYIKIGYFSTPLEKYISKYPNGFTIRYSVNTYTEGVKDYLFNYPGR